MADCEEVAETRRALGRQLAAYRQAAGYTQARFAPLTFYSRSTLANVEVGRQNVPRDFWERCDSAATAAGALVAASEALEAAIERQRDRSVRAARAERAAKVEQWRDRPSTTWQREDSPALDHEPELTLTSEEWTAADWTALASLLETNAAPTLAPHSIARLMHEWLVVEPPQLVELQSGRRVGEGLVARAERRVSQLRRLDDFVGGGDLHELVEREFKAMSALLRDASYTEPLAKRLFSATGELCQLAGWVTADNGGYDRAARYFGVGVKAAHAAGDRPLAANLISTLAYQLSNVGNRADGLLLAQTALAGAEHAATPTSHTLFRERVAWAHARAGHRRLTEQSLFAVEADYDRRRSEDDHPDWAYWLDEDEIAVMAARCYVELHDPELAIALLSDVLGHYNQNRVREVALYTSWLAEAHVQAGNIEQAAELATQTATMTYQTTSSRAGERVAVLHRLLRPHGTVAGVREFLELVHAG